jgi:hypothetical protein
MSILSKIGGVFRRWQHLPVRRSRGAGVRSASERYLLYFVLPAWLVPGLLDWAMHRRTKIEHTSGTRESALHALMMAEVGVPVTLGLLFEATPLVLATMIGNLALHTATAFWDVSLAVRRQREVRPNEQHLHSLLEVLPFMATSFMLCLHWDQARALLRPGSADWGLRLKRPRLPDRYLAGIGAGIAACLALPYAEELTRCVRADRQLATAAREISELAEAVAPPRLA